MIKVSTFLAESEFGLAAVPLFGPADAAFEKKASVGVLPEVLAYIERLRPRNDAQYVLVNAMGAGEFFGSNINGDHFPEAALIHKPDDWTGNPLLDKDKAKGWAYGFPTFYNAHPYAHHRNKDPSRAYGEVEFAAWNDHMKRVELIIRIDRDKCQLYGGVAVWDKCKAGQFPDVSMGSKVPYDTCAITLDWKLYREALATFRPRIHKHPGMAVLEFHKKLKKKNGKGIRGVSVTRNDYSEYAKKRMNQILPDGRKVFVWNDFPRFFDISFVFIGADKTAKVMIFIKRAGCMQALSSALTAEKMGLRDFDVESGEKTASVGDHILKRAFLKGAEEKRSEMDKVVVPSQFAGKAVPLLNKCEPDIPDSMLKAMSTVPLKSALATSSGLGMLLRPREFNRTLMLRSMRQKTHEDEDYENLSSDDFMPGLARVLMPMMQQRSALGPYIERRIIIISEKPQAEVPGASSLSPDLLRKMGAAYNGYRRGVMNVVASSQELIESATLPSEGEFHKLASAEVEELFTPLSYEYLTNAFKDELPPASDTAPGVVKTSSQAPANVERGFPSRNT
jgi:hypothetical protein